MEGGDHALFRARMSLDGSLYVAAMLTDSMLMTDDVTFTARLGKACLLDGLIGWDLLDDEGVPIPCTREVLESGRLSWSETLEGLAEKAAGLYGEEALAPLVRAATSMRKDAASSGTGQTESLTSRTQRRSSKPRRRS